jgi:hypothetical protein
MNPDSPTEAARSFLEAWRDEDWQKMAAHIQTSRRIGNLLILQHLENLFQARPLESFTITVGKDVGSAMSTMTALATVKGVRVTLALNVIHEDDKGRPVPRTAPGARWGVNEISALRTRPSG